MKTVAVIDVGSNTIKSLVLGKGEDLPTQLLHQEVAEVRIGRGMRGDPPALDSVSMNAAAEAVAGLLVKVREYEPDRLRIVSTSAVRDAVNRQTFADLIQEKTGETLEILTGQEEAAGIGAGIVQDAATGKFPSFSVSDLGGGSLEIIHFKEAQLTRLTSLQIGAVRLMHLHPPRADGSYPPETSSLIRQHTRDVLRAEATWPTSAAYFGTGGAFTVTKAILWHRRGLPMSMSAPLYVKDISRLADELCPLNLVERGAIPGLPAGRADVFPVALRIIEELAGYLGTDHFHHSFCNLRVGLASELLREI